MKRIAEGGLQHQGFIALNDGTLLVLGDQSPMVLMKVREDGSEAWRRTYPAHWVGPTAAALAGGASCIASPVYARQMVHLIWLDEQGRELHREQFSGWQSAVASDGESCVVLYSQGPLSSGKSEFLLTSFDSHYHRAWTVRVIDSAPIGASYALTALKDGYAVAVGAKGGLLLARYSTSGELLWSGIGESRREPEHIIGFGDSFYVIGGSVALTKGLHVIRAR